VTFTAGRIIVRGKMVTRGKRKRAGYVLSVKPNIPIAVIEAKDNSHAVGACIQQALDYAKTLHIPFAFSSNGDGFVLHDRTGASNPTEVFLPLDAFPIPRRSVGAPPGLGGPHARSREDRSSGPAIWQGPRVIYHYHIWKLSLFSENDLPLPPLSEQHRIVAKVDELMALCDRMEAGLNVADTVRNRLFDSLLHESLSSHEATINGNTGRYARVEA